MRKKIFLLFLMLILLICSTSCNSLEDPYELIDGDYSYTPQPLQMRLWDDSNGLLVQKLSDMKRLYIIAGKNDNLLFWEEYFKIYELKNDTLFMMRFPPLDAEITEETARGYFLTVYDLIRDYDILLPPNDSTVVFDSLHGENDYSNMFLYYQISPESAPGDDDSITCCLLLFKDDAALRQIPEDVPTYTLNGNGFKIVYWWQDIQHEHLWDRYVGLVYPEDQNRHMFNFSMYPRNPKTNPVTQDMVEDLANWQLMTLHEAIMASEIPKE